MALKRCLDCPRMTNRSRCPEHERARGRRKSEEFGGGYSWARTKERVLARDGGCVMPPPHGGRLEFDHIVPRSQGGSSADDNVRTLCHDHHVEVTR